MNIEISLEKIVKSGDIHAIRNSLRVISYHEILDVINHSDDASLRVIFSYLPLSNYIHIFPYLSAFQLKVAVESKDDEFIAKVLNHLESDDAVGILRRIPKSYCQFILPKLEKAALMARLLSFDPETAGGIMQTEVLKFPGNHTVKELVRFLKELRIDTDLYFKVFIVDDKRQLLGEIALNKLIYSETTDQLNSIMDKIEQFVHPDMDQEQVAQIMAKHDLIVIPVVDDKNRLLGRITFDDIQDIIEQEAKEDIALYAGTSKDEFESSSSIFKSASYRLPWLFFGIFSAMGSAKLIGLFKIFGDQSLILASLAPMIMTSSGNVGAQTSMINAQELSNQKDPRFYRFLLKKEIGLSFIISLSLACVAGALSYILYGNETLTFTMFVGTITSIITCSIMGVLLPNIFVKLKIDPALSTGPLMTPLCDIIALLSFFMGCYFFVS